MARKISRKEAHLLARRASIEAKAKHRQLLPALDLGVGDWMEVTDFGGEGKDTPAAVLNSWGMGRFRSRRSPDGGWLIMRMDEEIKVPATTARRSKNARKGGKSSKKDGGSAKAK